MYEYLQQQLPELRNILSVTSTTTTGKSMVYYQVILPLVLLLLKKMQTLLTDQYTKIIQDSMKEKKEIMDTIKSSLETSSAIVPTVQTNIETIYKRLEKSLNDFIAAFAENGIWYTMMQNMQGILNGVTSQITTDGQQTRALLTNGVNALGEHTSQ